MKILFVMDMNISWVSGCPCFVLPLMRALREKGHDTAIIVPSESLSNTLSIADDLIIYGFRSYPVIIQPGFRVSFMLFSSSRIKSILNDFKPDIIHFQNHFSVNRAVLKVAINLKTPLIMTNHSMPENTIHYISGSKIFTPLIKYLFWKDFSKIYKKIDTVTTPTKTAATLIQAYCKNKIHPISCGVDLNRFHPYHNTNFVRAKYRIPKVPILLYLGRLDREKNISLIIEAVSLVLKKTNLHLVIAGKGAEQTNLQKSCYKLNITDSVTFTGFISNEELPSLYCIADCFIISSTAELQSIVTMEAMASGLPILAANAVALPELVVNGVNGFLFDPKEKMNLVEKILFIMKNNSIRQIMGKESLRLIGEHALEKTVTQFEDLYIKLHSMTS